MLASRSLSLAYRNVVHFGIHMIGPAVDRRSVAFGVASESRSVEVASSRSLELAERRLRSQVLKQVGETPHDDGVEAFR